MAWYIALCNLRDPPYVLELLLKVTQNESKVCPVIRLKNKYATAICEMTLGEVREFHNVCSECCCEAQFVTCIGTIFGVLSCADGSCSHGIHLASSFSGIMRRCLMSGCDLRLAPANYRVRVLLESLNICCCTCVCTSFATCEFARGCVLVCEFCLHNCDDYIFSVTFIYLKISMIQASSNIHMFICSSRSAFVKCLPPI